MVIHELKAYTRGVLCCPVIILAYPKSGHGGSKQDILLDDILPGYTFQFLLVGSWGTLGPKKKYSLSIMFWVYAGVSSQLGVLGAPLGKQEPEGTKYLNRFNWNGPYKRCEVP